MMKLNAWSRACLVFLLWAGTAIASHTQTFTKFVSFDRADGLSPRSSAASHFKVLHAFTWAQSPQQGNLLLDAAGNVYGTTLTGGASGNGVVFKLAPHDDGTWTESTLYCFKGFPDGSGPIGPLILDAAGNLYGTTQWGGTSAYWGVVFKLTPTTNGAWKESVLFSFDWANGAQPRGGVIFDAAGNLYGTTEEGGPNGGLGTIFELTPNTDGTWKESVLHSFAGADGAGPYNALTFDKTGNLYGTAWYGGAYGNGAVFKLAINSDGSTTESTLYNFQGGGDGRGPFGVVFDAAGNLYGMTQSGGIGCPYVGCGVVFKLTPNPDGTWTESVLHMFTGGSDGSSPYAGVISDATGNLYGTTYTGGCAGNGVVFRLTPTSNGWHETVLHCFSGYGAFPWAGLTMDGAGSLYGTTSSGRNNSGLVFEIAP